MLQGRPFSFLPPAPRFRAGGGRTRVDPVASNRPGVSERPGPTKGSVWGLAPIFFKSCLGDSVVQPGINQRLRCWVKGKAPHFPPIREGQGVGPCSEQSLGVGGERRKGEEGTKEEG